MVFESVNFYRDYLVNKSLSMDTTKEGNQLVSIDSYVISEYNVNFFTFKIIPNQDIDYIIVNFEIGRCLFFIDTLSNSPYYNLTGGRDYYVMINYFSLRMNITLEMSCKDDEMPFDYLYFSETYTKFENTSRKLSYKDIQIQKKEDKIIASYIYESNLMGFRYLYAKFTAKYDLPYFLPRYELL